MTVRSLYRKSQVHELLPNRTSGYIVMYGLQFFVFIALLMPLSSAIQCPQGRGCSNCQRVFKNRHKILCSTSISNSVFEVYYEPDSWLDISCENAPNWSEFHLGTAKQIQDVDTIFFWECQLPKGKLSDITGQIIANDIKKLQVRMDYNLTWTLSSKTLAGFEGLETLDLSWNGLMNVTADLLHDLQNLKCLKLGSNFLRELPTGFLNLDNLEEIQLERNKLEVFESTTFDKLGKLKHLNIWSNNLVEIKPHSFDKLKSLELLHMHKNNLQTLPEDIFAKLENLMGIDLSQNNFSANSLPERLFRNNSLLETIDFFENKQNLTTLPPKFFANLTRLMGVNITGNKLVYLPEDLFEVTINLNHLSMERNYIEKLPRNIFKDCVELRTIKLSDNKLKDLPNGIFSTLHKLVKLDLSRNHITTIDENTFDGLSLLHSLNMERNELKTIHPLSFRPLEILRIARFSSNQLTLEQDGDSPFHLCHKLKHLYLADNNISKIFRDWNKSYYLRTLNLRNNSLRFLTKSSTSFVSKKLKVDLSFNHIKEMEWSFATHQVLEMNHIGIWMENNPITCDCNQFDLHRYRIAHMHSKLECHKPIFYPDIVLRGSELKPLKCLIKYPEDYAATCPQECQCWLTSQKIEYLVDCSYKNITEAPKSLKSPPGRPIELDLTGNSLTRMPSMTQNGYDSVTVLSISKNKITEVPLDALSQNLQVLNLDSNNLTRLETPVLDFLRNSTEIRKLNLQTNPWSCDCDSKEFLSFITQKKVDIPELQEVRCSVSNAPIFEMTPEEMCTLIIAEIIGACIGLALLLGIIIGIIPSLYYRFQVEIKVWLYAKQWCLWFVTEDELDKDKLYDAFISHSHKDEDFVRKLAEKLEEGEKPFKLCVHYRDWLAGELIPMQIARSVEDSRRTIVVLSPNFLESIWGKMEFRTAHNQALSEGRTRVIIILYEKIEPVDELDPELKAYLTMNTYVKWGDPWFWEKLKYALPHREGLIMKTTKQTVFETQQPTIVIPDEEIELIEDATENGTTQRLRLADTLTTFASDENGNNKLL